MMYSADNFLVPKQPKVAAIGDYGMQRLIAIGDPHGCHTELMQLLVKVDPRPTDILVVLGDFVDRGPDSPGVVKSVMHLCANRPGTYAVLGNHDEKHARYRRHEVVKRDRPDYRNPMKTKERFRETNQQLSDEALAWVAALPSVVVLEKSFMSADPTPAGRIRYLTHAGLVPGLGINQPTSGLIRNRYIKPTTEGRWTAVGMGPNFSRPEGADLWDEVWDPMKGRVITGHIVHSLTTPRVHNNCYGIDTGCCFGGQLTAYVEDLHTGDVTFAQVPAAKVYFDQKENDGE